MGSKKLITHRDNKTVVSSENAYFVAQILISFSVALSAKADLGMSMIAAPCYILNQRFPFLTYGQWEYIFQGLLFIIMCVAIKKFRPIFLFAFFTSLMYGTLIDLWRLIPWLNPAVSPPESVHIVIRVIYFLIGMVITAFAVTLFFKTYIYPAVPDFFVKAVSERYSIDRTKFKRIFDLALLAVSVVLSFSLFGSFVGVGFGTIFITVFNGIIIGLFDKMLDKHLIFEPRFPLFAEKFGI